MLDAGPELYKCYTNDVCFLESKQLLPFDSKLLWVQSYIIGNNKNNILNDI